jgi:hypothetical protein
MMRTTRLGVRISFTAALNSPAAWNRGPPAVLT